MQNVGKMHQELNFSSTQASNIPYLSYCSNESRETAHSIAQFCSPEFFRFAKIYWFRVISSPHLFEYVTWTSTLIWLISCRRLINGVWTWMSWLLTLQTENPSVIYFEGKDYTFEGFSMFCHHPLEHVSLKCFPFPSTLFFFYTILYDHHPFPPSPHS